MVAISVFTVKSFNFKFENFYDYNVVEKSYWNDKEKMGIWKDSWKMWHCFILLPLNYLISP